MNLTRREFIKIIGAGVFCLVTAGCISKLSKISISGNMQTFSIRLIHSPFDSDNGKEFMIQYFPINCIIKEIRIRSNFTAGLQNWRVAFVDNEDGMSPTDTNISCRTAEIFEAGDYIFIGDEIVNVIKSDPINNTMIVKRGAKGTVPMRHYKGTRMETINNGLRVLLYKDRNYRLDDSLNMYDIMTWKGVTNSSIAENDKKIIVDNIKNVKKYDMIYINDANSERISVIGVNNGVENSLYVKDPISAHGIGTEIQKQIIYDTPIIYSGIETYIYGILYIDEKITKDVIVNIDITVVYN